MKLSYNQLVIIENLIQELTNLKKVGDLNSYRNIVNIKTTLRKLEEENVIKLDQNMDLEIYLFGIMNLLKEVR